MEEQNTVHESICWFCGNEECQWMRNLKPFSEDEWLAEETDTMGGSYHVYECKAFKPGKRSISNAYPKRITTRIVPTTTVLVCPVCKRNVRRTDRFCSRCGQRIYYREDIK